VKCEHGRSARGDPPMTAHDTAPIILWRTALGGTVAAEAPTTAQDTCVSATDLELPASDRDSAADTPRQNAHTTSAKFDVRTGDRDTP
jgi:hypothetical protein